MHLCVAKCLKYCMPRIFFMFSYLNDILLDIKYYVQSYFPSILWRHPFASSVVEKSDISLILLPLYSICSFFPVLRILSLYSKITLECVQVWIFKIILLFSCFQAEGFKIFKFVLHMSSNNFLLSIFFFLLLSPVTLDVSTLMFMFYFSWLIFCSFLYILLTSELFPPSGLQIYQLILQFNIRLCFTHFFPTQYF